ncbi:hypothetical protein NQZ68_010565 [Dissostichus eleginoides]|nr:hypothetical protein NQZ68_010565 [Dissostichus eleginoides]
MAWARQGNVFRQAELLNQVSAHGSMLTWNSTPETGHPTVSGGQQLRSVLPGLITLSGIPGITLE